MRTEISVKFVRERVSHMLNEADLALLDWQTDKQGLFGLALSGPKRHGTAHGRVMRDLNLTYESHSGASENLLLSSDRVTRHNNLERLSDDEAEERLLHVPK